MHSSNYISTIATSTLCPQSYSVYKDTSAKTMSLVTQVVLCLFDSHVTVEIYGYQVSTSEYQS